MHYLDKIPEMLNKYKSRPIMVYGDPDVDGLLAMLITCQFLDSRGSTYSYYINSERAHGFMLEPSILTGYFVIAVDFGIPRSIVQKLVDNNVAIICLDHHSSDDIDFVDCTNHDYNTEGVVFNNQYDFEPADDRYLSGAGVVYEAFSACYPEFKSKEREAMVGITLLADERAIENKKARGYLKTLYTSDPQTGYIGYLVRSVLDKDYGFGMPRMDRSFVDYTFSPRVNSLLRFGRKNEAIDFILGKGLGGGNTQKLQSELLSQMKSRCRMLELANLKVLAVNSIDFPNVHITSFIGALCSNIKGTGKSVLGFVYENGVVLRASFRGRYSDINYLEGFRLLGINAGGHPPAFGIKELYPTEDLWTKLDTLVRGLEVSHTLQAKIYDVNNLSIFTLQMGLKLASENCYVRDMYRSYINYTGTRICETHRSYVVVPLDGNDLAEGVTPDFKQKGVAYKYARDSEGNRITKYIEYSVDGQTVKSFGVELKDGYILPMLEKSYMQLYVREKLT